jgi:SAM-dependent methyltransferase
MSQAKSFPNWEELYKATAKETMPWYYPALDPDLERALAAQGITAGKALDLGTGPATQALALAERGFTVTGTDLSASAVAGAVEAARQRGVAARFLEDDILASRLDEAFDVVFDRGCFHVLPPDRRSDYALTLARLLAPRGFFFLKCFSVNERGNEAPHRFAPGDIHQVFDPHVEILGIEETVYQGTLQPLPRALFCSMRAR